MSRKFRAKTPPPAPHLRSVRGGASEKDREKIRASRRWARSKVTVTWCEPTTA